MRGYVTSTVVLGSQIILEVGVKRLINLIDAGFERRRLGGERPTHGIQCRHSTKIVVRLRLQTSSMKSQGRYGM